MRILAVGDSYMPPAYFREAFRQLHSAHLIEYLQVDPARSFRPVTSSELKIREYQGSPAELAERMRGIEVLAVHGAPVTEEVLAAAPDLRLVCCARGGPVNVDVEAMSSRGLPLVNTPGKNAEGVADLTLAFLIMLGRGLPRAQRFLVAGNQLADTYAGSQFFGSELGDHVLGLVGCGQIGSRVAIRASAFGMTVLGYDPYIDVCTAVDLVESLTELVERSHFVSLHARATPETEDLFDREIFANLRPGAFFVNTARETLVDEDALDDALSAGRVAGAALDVIRPREATERHPLLRHENVILTPHIGGATHETLLRGSLMLAAEIERFDAGKALNHVVNSRSVST